MNNQNMTEKPTKSNKGLLSSASSSFLKSPCAHTVAAGVQGPLKGLGSSRFFLMLSRSCYLSLIFKHSDTKMEVKNTFDQVLWGGGGEGWRLLRLLWIRHYIVTCDFIPSLYSVLRKQ